MAREFDAHSKKIKIFDKQNKANWMILTQCNPLHLNRLLCSNKKHVFSTDLFTIVEEMFYMCSLWYDVQVVIAMIMHYCHRQPKINIMNFVPEMSKIDKE